MANTLQLLGEKEGAEACKYFKRKLIGSGSYGEAWLAERVEDHRMFVAKTMNLIKMSTRDKQYAYSEIKCLANCRHPNIIEYMEDQEENDQLLIVMEFADSGDLDRQIKARAADNLRYFQEHEALFLFIQLCLALDHIHRHKMLHRDIKAANVLLTSGGLIKLGDFGFSRQYDDTVSGVVANTFCGTPYYLAPELWNNQRYSKKADVWSLGVLLYEIMSLRRPFAASNMRALMAKVLEANFPPLPDKYSPAFCAVVKAVLCVDANERPSISDIFQMPFIQEGLRVFLRTIRKNTRIPEDVKDSLSKHVSEILAGNAADANCPKSVVGAINKDVSYGGVVKKLGGSSGHSWKERFLQLQLGHLILSEKEGDAEGKALSLEQLQSVCPVPMGTAKREWVFALNTLGGKSMWLQALSRESMEAWIQHIQQALGVA